MTLEDLLTRLDGVRQRGTRWSALCPSHPDKSPSLQITKGDKAVLLKCWAGCHLEEICASLGIRPADLFFDALESDPCKRQAAAQERERRQNQQAAEVHQQGRRIDALKAADYHVRSRRELDITGWSDQKLDDELNVVADAHALLAIEGING